MANTITLSSDVPVVAPGKTLNLTAKVFDSESGKGAEGMNVKWTIAPATTSATLGKTSVRTSAAGYAANTVACEVKAAVTVTATLDDGSGASATLEVGFYSSELVAPDVPQAKNGILTEKEVKSTVQARVMRHTDDPAAGDLYNFYWGKNSISRFDDGTSETFPWVINIKNDFTATEVLADGDYTVYYTVTDLAQNVSYSVPKSITVTGGTYVNPLYDAPEFPDITDNTINYDDVLGDGVQVKVPLPQSRESEGASIFAGNTITLYMRVFDKNYKTEIIATKVVATYSVTQMDIDNGTILVTLPKNVITDNKDTFDDVRGQFWYTVTGTGSVSISGSSFTKTLIIDTVPPHLPQV
ncbi:hypothetical protein [Pantoea agglomerans]|uniref:hypothetical protein n=1 Tax=Enterobacter agglomerans TaxID=549 RepID=UPI002412F9C9|nr:hypothetical protein [Pantoea agglomerans]